MKRLLGLNGLILFAAVALLSSCGENKSSNLVSSKTGWNFNDTKLGGFDVPLYEGQYIGPGLSFIEGGRFTMGQTEEDLTYENNNQENGENENGNIEIIQEIQALGQSEMMVGKLECAEKYFLRQYEMCCKALNLKILKVKNAYTIEFNENFNPVEFLKNSDISLSKNNTVLESVSQPQVKRKRDTLTKFLLFSVYL